jgi:hypothetical protein
LPKKKAKKKTRKKASKRAPRAVKDATFLELLQLSRFVFKRHLVALSTLRPQQPGEEFEEYAQYLDSVKGHLGVNQAELVRKAIKELSELCKGGEIQGTMGGGWSPSEMSDTELEEAAEKILKMSGG